MSSTPSSLSPHDASPATATQPPAWALALRRYNNGLMYDLGGGPRPWKFAWIINFQKGGTFLFLGLLMWLYAPHTPAATAPAAWIYLALHGSYGLVWLLKDFCFPDSGWQHRITIGGGLFALFGLAIYWSFGWLLISGRAASDYPLPDAPWFALCITLVVTGSALMVAADAQKFYTLRLQKGLIADGVHRFIRHPNYLGEIMIYAGFALLVWHWLPFVWLAYIWLTLFATNMVLKEASMSRHPGWSDYRKRSWWLIPGVF